MTIEISNLSIGYRETVLASDINLSLTEGRATALIGRNGAGKSTLIKTLTGELKPLAGKVTIDGREVGSYTKKELSRILALVTTEDNMAGGLRLRELVSLGRIPLTGKMGILSRDDKAMVDRAMKEVGISHKAESYVAQLSDGERQKGMIARGLVQETPLILLDEPLTYLDVASRLEIMQLLNRLAESEGKTILYSTHEVSEALQMAKSIWMIAENRLTEGSPQELIERDEINRLFPDSPVKYDAERGKFVIIN